MFIFYILTFCIQKFNSLKLAPEPPKGNKMEKDDGRWWEVRAAQAMMGGGGSSVGGRGSGGSGGRAWEIAPEPPKGDKLQVEGQVIGKR